MKDIPSREKKYLHKWRNSFLGILQCQYYLEMLRYLWEKNQERKYIISVPILPEKINAKIPMRKIEKGKYILGAKTVLTKKSISISLRNENCSVNTVWT